MFYVQKHLNHKAVAATGHSAPVFPEFEAGRITTLAKNKFSCLIWTLSLLTEAQQITLKCHLNKSPYWQKFFWLQSVQGEQSKYETAGRIVLQFGLFWWSSTDWSSLVGSVSGLTQTKSGIAVKIWILPFLFLDVGIAVMVWVQLFPVLFCSSICVCYVLPCTSSLCPFPPFSCSLVFHL